VRISGDDAAWQPSASGYADYREYAGGEGWKVWVGLPGNPGVQQAPLRAAFPSLSTGTRAPSTCPKAC
jgi:alpha-amylase